MTKKFSGQRLREFRLMRGWSITTLSRELYLAGLSAVGQTVSNWETGQTQILFNNAIIVADVIVVDLLDLTE